MTTQYANVAPAIDRRFGSGAARAFAERCDRSPSGSWLCTLEFERETRWCEVRADEASEIQLARESELPAAPWIAERVDQRTATILSWRPGRRVVARVAGDREIAKGYRRGRSRKAAERHRRVAERSSSESFHVPGILEEDAELELVRFECFAGRALDPLEDRAALAQAGRNLAHFQRSSPAGDLPTHSWQDELAALERMSVTWRRDVGELPEGWSVELERLREWEPGDVEPTTCAHGDLHDGQILVGERTLALIDLDLARSAERELDLGNLCAHVYLSELKRALRSPNDAARAAEDALLSGYRAAGGAGVPAALARYKSSTALRLALVYGIRPRWAHLSAPLVSLSRRFAAEP